MLEEKALLRHSTFPWQQLCGCLANGNRETPTLPSWNSVNLGVGGGVPDSCTAATAWEEERGKDGQQEDAECPRTPR